MTVAESTISMVNQLTKPEMLSVQKYIKHLLELRPEKPQLKTYTEAEFIKLIDKSIKQSQTGDVYSWADIRKEPHAHHAI